MRVSWVLWKRWACRGYDLSYSGSRADVQNEKYCDTNRNFAAQMCYYDKSLCWWFTFESSSCISGKVKWSFFQNYCANKKVFLKLLIVKAFLYVYFKTASRNVLDFRKFWQSIFSTTTPISQANSHKTLKLDSNLNFDSPHPWFNSCMQQLYNKCISVCRPSCTQKLLRSFDTKIVDNTKIFLACTKYNVTKYPPRCLRKGERTERVITQTEAS